MCVIPASFKADGRRREKMLYHVRSVILTKASQKRQAREVFQGLPSKARDVKRE